MISDRDVSERLQNLAEIELCVVLDFLQLGSPNGCSKQQTGEDRDDALKTEMAPVRH